MTQYTNKNNQEVCFEKLSREKERLWNEVLNNSSQKSIYHSLKYRDFLTSFLNESTEDYQLIYMNSELMAILPVFLRHGPLGLVMNSLPFFGSHGGLIWNPHKEISEEDQKKILNAIFEKYSYNQELASLTIIEPLFEKNHYEISINKQILETRRIGQYSILELLENENGEFPTLEKLFSAKKQWDIKKARNHGFQIEQISSERTIFELYSLHQENMQNLGGKKKPYSVFANVIKNFESEIDYKVYLAWHNNQAVAGLLLFFFGNQIEYFVPAVKLEFRSSQVLSLLIFEAMKQHVDVGSQLLWNWGGTWPSQIGVYNFKKSWNAMSKEYRYHTVLSEDERLLDEINGTFLDNYPFFYLFPFVRDRM